MGQRPSSVSLPGFTSIILQRCASLTSDPAMRTLVEPMSMLSLVLSYPLRCVICYFRLQIWNQNFAAPLYCQLHREAPGVFIFLPSVTGDVLDILLGCSLCMYGINATFISLTIYYNLYFKCSWTFPKRALPILRKLLFGIFKDPPFPAFPSVLTY